jgi:hypothetical protein
VRPRSEAFGTTLALLGLIGTSATVFFLTGVTAYLGEGGTERAAAYPLPLGLALAGALLWRLGRTTGDTAGGAGAPERASRREERERARAERAARDRARDEALAAGGSSMRAANHGSDEFDPDAPWAGPTPPRD